MNFLKRKKIANNSRFFSTISYAKIKPETNAFIKTHIANNLPSNTYPLLTDNKQKIKKILLNSCHKENILTSKLIKALTDEITDAETNYNTEAIILDMPKNESIFCAGTDFKTIHYLLTHGKIDDAENKIRELFQFSEKLSIPQKPLITILRKPLYNSASTIFTMTPFAMVSPGAYSYFNDIDFNFIPHGGSSYILSRLPHKYGMYLALTGGVLSSEEMVYLSFASRKHNFTDEDLINIREQIQCYKKPAGTANKLIASNNNASIEAIEMKEKNEYNIQYLTSNILEHNSENMRQILSSEVHKANLLKWANLKFSDINPSSFILKDDFDITNYTKHFKEDFFDFYFAENHSKDFYVKIENIKTIENCFDGSSVSEIIAKLKEKNSDFAKKCIEKIENHNPLMLEIIFQLITQANNKDLVGCMNLEYNIICNLFRSNNFLIDFDARMNGKKQFKTKQFSENQIADLMAQTRSYKGLLPEYCVSPLKEHYLTVPDNALLYLNEVNTLDPQIRHSHIIDSFFYLYSQGIDPKSPGFSLDATRKALFHKQQDRRILEEKYARVDQIAKSSSNYEKYFGSRIEEINKYFQNPNCEKNLSLLISEEFNNFFEINIKNMNESIRRHTIVAKKKYFKELRDLIFQNRFIISNSDSEIAEGFIDRLIEFDKNNNKSLDEILDEKITKEELNLIKTCLQPKAKLSKSSSKLISKGDISLVEFIKFYGSKSFQLFKSLNHLIPGEAVVNNSVTKNRAQYRMLYGLNNVDLNIEQNLVDQVITLMGGDTNMAEEKKKEIREEIERFTRTELNYDSEPYVNSIHQNGKTAISSESITNFYNCLTNMEKEKMPLETPSEKSDLIFDNNLKFVNNYEQMICEFVDLDEELQKNTNHLFGTLNENKKHVEAAQHHFKRVLIQIYQKKIHQLLQKNNKITPKYFDSILFDENEKNSLNHLKFFDLYIKKNIRFELNSYMAAHVFFAYSLEVIEILETIFNSILHNDVEKETFQNWKKVQARLSYKYDFVSKIKNASEFEDLMLYLDNVVRQTLSLYLEYNTKLHSNDDIYTKTAIRLTYEPDQTDEIDHKLQDFLLTYADIQKNYLDSEELLSNKKNYFEGKDMLENYRFALINHEDVPALDSDSDTLADSSYQVNHFLSELEIARNNIAISKNKPRLMPGSEQYALSLEQIYSKITQGEKGGFVGSYDKYDEKSSIFPKNFDSYDIQQSAKEWLDRKLRLITQNLFTLKANYDRTLFDSDIVIMDILLEEILSKTSLANLMTKALNNEKSFIIQRAKEINTSRMLKDSLEILETRLIDTTNYFNLQVKNQNALKMYMATNLYHRSLLLSNKKLAFSLNELLTLKTINDRQISEIFMDPNELEDYMKSDESKKLYEIMETPKTIGDTTEDDSFEDLEKKTLYSDIRQLIKEHHNVNPSIENKLPRHIAESIFKAQKQKAQQQYEIEFSF